MQKYWRVLILVTIAAVASSTSAFAVPVTYQFSGILTDIRDSGAGFKYGDNFSASFTYDDTPVNGSLIEPGRMGFSTGQLNVQAAGKNMSGTSTSELQVFNNWTNAYGGYYNADGFFVSSYIYDTHGFTLLQFDLWDNNNGTKLNSLSLPTQRQLVDLAATGRIFIRRFDDGQETGLASGIFSGFLPLSAIPEPTQIWTLMIGLLVVSYLVGRVRPKAAVSNQNSLKH
jgi:hypothetical protein